jgi:hypothetical protein
LSTHPFYERDHMVIRFSAIRDSSQKKHHLAVHMLTHLAAARADRFDTTPKRRR